VVAVIVGVTALASGCKPSTPGPVAVSATTSPTFPASPTGSPSPDPAVVAANARVAKATAAAAHAMRVLAGDFRWVGQALPSGAKVNLDPKKMYLFAAERKALSSAVGRAQAAITRARNSAKARPRNCAGVAVSRRSAYSNVRAARSAYSRYRATITSALSDLSRAQRDRVAANRAMAALSATLKANPSATNQPRIEVLLSTTYTAQEQASLASAVQRASTTARARLIEAERLGNVAGRIAPRCG
jgi:hypothetical protein